MNPPSDQAEWANLIRAIVEHWISRYGVEEVRSWYFEVWNEVRTRLPCRVTLFNVLQMLCADHFSAAESSRILGWYKVAVLRAV